MDSLRRLFELAKRYFSTVTKKLAVPKVGTSIKVNPPGRPGPCPSCQTVIFRFCRNRQAPKEKSENSSCWQSNFGHWQCQCNRGKLPNSAPEPSGAQPETRRAGGLVPGGRGEHQMTSGPAHEPELQPSTGWPALAAGEGLVISLGVRAPQLVNPCCAGTAGSTLAWDSLQPWPGMGTESHATQQNRHKGAAKRSNTTAGKAEFELATDGIQFYALYQLGSREPAQCRPQHTVAHARFIDLRRGSAYPRVRREAGPLGALVSAPGAPANLRVPSFGSCRRPAGARVLSCRTRPPCAFSRVRVMDPPFTTPWEAVDGLSGASPSRAEPLQQRVQAVDAPVSARNHTPPRGSAQRRGEGWARQCRPGLRRNRRRP